MRILTVFQSSFKAAGIVLPAAVFGEHVLYYTVRQVFWFSGVKKVIG